MAPLPQVVSWPLSSAIALPCAREVQQEVVYPRPGRRAWPASFAREAIVPWFLGRSCRPQMCVGLPQRVAGRPAAPRRSNGRLPSAMASQLCLVVGSGLLKHRPWSWRMVIWPLPVAWASTLLALGDRGGRRNAKKRAFLSPAWCVCQAAWAAASPPCYAANHGRGEPATLSERSGGCRGHLGEAGKCGCGGPWLRKWVTQPAGAAAASPRGGSSGQPRWLVGASRSDSGQRK
jgi:hypothetical protein